MSTRIHVAAVRNVPISELKQELRMLGEFEMHEANGWVWFMASVWGVSAGALLETLEKVPRTTLLATTQDGTRWYLRLRAPGQEPYNLCHEFAMLGGDGEDEYALADSDDDYGEDEDSGMSVVSFNVGAAAPGADTDDDTFFNEDDDEDDLDDDDEPYDPIEEIIRDKRELFGCPLPEGVEEHLRSLPPQEAMPWLFAWESAGLIGALKRFHVPHDADEVASIILGESVTGEELESDLGSLPRLLAALGLGEYWDQTVEQLCETEVDDEEIEFEPEDDPINAILDVAEDCVPLPLTGDAVEIPLEKAGAIALLARFCDPEANALFHVGAAGAAPAIRPAYWLTIRGDGEAGVYVATAYGEALTGRRVRKIGKRLKELPDGAALEIVTASDEMTSGVHCYTGPVTNGRWRIEQAAPCNDAEAIREAVTLALAVSEGAELRARDDREAQAVLEAARTNAAFEQVPLHREGLVFDVRRAQREALGRLIFRQRFREFWDVEEGESADANEFAQWQAMKKEIDASLGIPYTGRTIFEGKATRYLEVDVAKFKPELAAAVRDADEEFRAIGFEPIGALVAQTMSITIMRGYANNSARTYAVLYPQSYGESWMDCYSRFEGGVSLTTSTMPGQFSLRNRGIYHRTARTKDTASVLAEHQRGLDILAKKGLTLEPTPSTLEGLARALDHYLLRRLPA